MTARRDQAVVVGLGQAAAGDDAVGLLVARAISAQGGSAVESSDATVVLDLLAGRRHVVIVDAVFGTGRAGDVLRLWPEELAGDHPAVSCHGIGLASALALAGVLLGADALGAVDIVGVVVDGKPEVGSSLSAAVAASVGPAAALALRLARKRI